MEWLKSKYDRLLLGLFGVIALIIGGMLLMKVLTFKSTNFKPRVEPPIKSEFGTDVAVKKLAAAKTRLSEPAEMKPPVINGVPISLFVSAPVVKTASGEVIPIRDPNAAPLRPPVPNVWLYENDLDITRNDIAQVDSDDDLFTNTEEFESKTNPRDKSSTPPFWAKLSYVQVIEDPLTIRFNTYLSDTELSFRRTEPPEKAFNTPIDFKVGDSFSEEKGGTEKRFKVVKVIPPAGAKQHVAVIEDLKTKQKHEIEYRASLKLPTLKARIVCSLGKEEEQIVYENGEAFSFEVNPDYKFTATRITPEEVDLEFTPPGAAAPMKITLKLKAP
jgi:hypothetical protein